MGDYVRGISEADSQHKHPLVSKIAAVVLVLLGIFSPIMINSYGYSGNYDFYINSLLWTFHCSNWGTDFYLTPFYYLFSIFPILILRLVPVSQIVRYYHGKTTRRRAFLGVIIGDIFFVIVGLITLMFSLASPYPTFSLPLPIQMLVGFLVLWIFPIPEPTTPWDSTSETKSWWEQDKREYSEIIDTEEDKDRLW